MGQWVDKKDVIFHQVSVSSTNKVEANGILSCCARALSLQGLDPWSDRDLSPDLSGLCSKELDITVYSQGAGHCLWVDVLTEFVFVHQPVGVIPLRYDGTTSWTGCHLDPIMQAGCCFISTQQHEWGIVEVFCAEWGKPQIAQLHMLSSLFCMLTLSRCASSSSRCSDIKATHSFLELWHVTVSVFKKKLLPTNVLSFHVACRVVLLLTTTCFPPQHLW